MKKALVLAGTLLAAASWQACRRQRPPAPKYALLKTSKGTVTLRLFADKAPVTVAHFIGLASGTKPWRDPRDGKTKFQPLYDGVLFHRVVPGFVIQTGDPLGNGTGEIGTAVADEFHPDLRYDRPGLVGMANYGPNTNGSQFFITLAPAPDLDGRHTIFGEVVSGLGVVKAIAEVPRDTAHEIDRPLKPVLLESVTIADALP